MFTKPVNKSEHPMSLSHSGQGEVVDTVNRRETINVIITL